MVIMFYKPLCKLVGDCKIFYPVTIATNCYDDNYSNIISYYYQINGNIQSSTLLKLDNFIQYAVYTGNKMDKEIFKFNYNENEKSFSQNDVSIVPDLKLQVYETPTNYGDKAIFDFPLKITDYPSKITVQNALLSDMFNQNVLGKNIDMKNNSQYKSGLNTKLSDVIANNNFIHICACRSSVLGNKAIGIPVYIYLFYSIFISILKIIDINILTLNVFVDRVHELLKKQEFYTIK